MKKLMVLSIIFMMLTACNPNDKASEQANTSPMPGSMGGMMGRHHARIPEPYAGMTNPIPADEASVERGGAAYATNCASCHGDGGMGDGPAGASLDPAPSPIAHTSQMIGDAYLFWRISEGGAGFSTSMPGWKDSLDENTRWDVINYVQALGAGKVEPVSSMGGAQYDPAVQATHQAEMLANAVDQGVLSQSEADLFNRVHDAIEAFQIANPDFMRGGGATERQAAILDALVKEQVISQADAEEFQDIHDRLGASGLMP